MIDLTQGYWWPLIVMTLLLAMAIFMRYLLMAGLFYYFFHVRFRERFYAQRIDQRKDKSGQIRSEIYYSLLSSVLFACLGTMVWYSYQMGGTRIYTGWYEYHWSWLGVSVILVLIMHETYYYWLHRWMHKPQVYRRIHRTHHESLVTTAWTSFSFHPVESLLQALPILVVIYYIPLHLVSLIVLLLIMTVTSVINHLNSEIYPAGSHRHWFGKWCIGATHHALHHSQFKYNFGLYFTFWDHWMHTESPAFDTLFEEKTRHDH